MASPRESLSFEVLFDGLFASFGPRHGHPSSWRLSVAEWLGTSFQQQFNSTSFSQDGGQPKTRSKKLLGAKGIATRSKDAPCHKTPKNV